MLHPEAQALIHLIEQSGAPPLNRLPPVEARRVYRDRRGLTQPQPPDVGSVRSAAAEGPHGAIALRLYRPLQSRPEAVLPVLVYFHGGGWTIGDLDTHDVLCRQLCNGSGCALVSVDYRMGPENRFPAAVDDAYAATGWVAEHAAELGVDAARLAVGGDSAGGNLAATVALMARDAARPAIRFQLLIYPATDLRSLHASHSSNGKGYLLTSELNRYYQDQYIADPAAKLDWRASPLLCPDLARLPPALVLTAGYDPLLDEGLAYADALVQAGNKATYVCFARQIHGFITMGKVIDEANTAVRLCAAELAQALAPATAEAIAS